MALDSTTLDLISLALNEDLGPGDVTSELIPENAVGAAELLCKEDLCLAGIEAFNEAYGQIDENIEIQFHFQEGDEIAAGEVMASLAGPTRSMLSAERVALNLLQHLCGVATQTRRCVEAIGQFQAKLVDTRKTMPGMRALEKRAVRIGGGKNHRFGLFDGILIKDNHIAAVGSVAGAIEKAKKIAHHLMRIECEVSNVREFNDAREAGADIIMLDNMSLAEMKIAVAQNNGRVLLEASGNVTYERLREIAETGVDLISMGSLTHSVKASDISMRWKL